MIADAIEMQVQRLFHLALYRSRTQQLLHASGIARLFWDSAMYQTQVWLEHQDSRRDKTLPLIAIAWALSVMRALKRNATKLLQQWRARAQQ
jgi:hypothetical protein